MSWILSTLLWLLAFSIALMILKITVQNIIKMYHVAKLPTPPAENFLLGNVATLNSKTPAESFHIVHHVWPLQYYPLYYAWVMLIFNVFVIGPEDIELVLKSVVHNEKGMLYNLLRRWLGTGLLTAHGKKWHSHRKMLTPAFHYSILQNFVPVFNEETLKIVDFLKTRNAKSQTTEVNSMIASFTLKTICETSMGKKLNFTGGKEKSYKEAFDNLFKLFTPRMTRPWMFYNIFYIFTPMYYQEGRLLKVLQDFTRDIIQDRKKTFIKSEMSSESDDIKGSKKRIPMLDVLLTVKNEGGAITDEEIREEVDTFLFEGHDTTAVALSYGLMLIACHPEAQNKIVEEMHQILGDIKRAPTVTELLEMNYLERVIKEVLRLYPSVPAISRILGEDIIMTNGVKLKKGSTVNISIYATHRSPKLYPNPDKFDPDRFLPEVAKTRHPFAFIPFSAGPRNCIGQKYAMLELKSFLCGILGNFILEPVDTPETILLVMDLILRTRDPIKVKFVPRS